MPIPGLTRQAAARRLRRPTRMLAGVLLVVAGSIFIADAGFG